MLIAQSPLRTKLRNETLGRKEKIFNRNEEINMSNIKRKFAEQKNASKILNTLSVFLSNEDNLELKEQDNGFYTYTFKHKYGTKCPFSLMLDANGERLFLSIGEPNRDATVFHYDDITTDSAVKVILDFIDDFLHSKVEEVSLFCRGRLKKISYKILSTQYFPKYSYLHASYFICVNRMKETRIYQEWIVP